MKTFVLVSIFFGMACLTDATDLRGRIDGIHAYSTVPFPLAGASITIFVPQQTPYGIQYSPVASTITGNDGMYYFRNMPPGSFVLQVAGVNYPLLVYPRPAQDIQAILVRF